MGLVHPTEILYFLQRKALLNDNDENNQTEVLTNKVVNKSCRIFPDYYYKAIEVKTGYFLIGI